MRIRNTFAPNRNQLGKRLPVEPSIRITVSARRIPTTVKLSARPRVILYVMLELRRLKNKQLGFSIAFSIFLTSQPLHFSTELN